mmetsp:Transcript_21869/g.60894  ORF Transcript_21869/g.60894 Transcript_21869/m.60894 type:complete len:310 (+) Transcript_21869:289-1218(+)
MERTVFDVPFCCAYEVRDVSVAATLDFLLFLVFQHHAMLHDLLLPVATFVNCLHYTRENLSSVGGIGDKRRYFRFEFRHVVVPFAISETVVEIYPCSRHQMSPRCNTVHAILSERNVIEIMFHSVQVVVDLLHFQGFPEDILCLDTDGVHCVVLQFLFAFVPLGTDEGDGSIGQVTVAFRHTAQRWSEVLWCTVTVLVLSHLCETYQHVSVHGEGLFLLAARHGGIEVLLFFEVFKRVKIQGVALPNCHRRHVGPGLRVLRFGARSCCWRLPTRFACIQLVIAFRFWLGLQQHRRFVVIHTVHCKVALD